MAHQNYSKSRDTRQWDKWNLAGAVGTIDGAVKPEVDYRERELQAYDGLAYAKFEELVKSGGAFIDTKVTNFENNYTTISIGRKQIGPNFYRPVCYLVVPIDNGLKCGQILTELPKGAVSVERVYGVRDKTSSLSRSARTQELSSKCQFGVDNVSKQTRNSGKRHYVQTNESGYVTGIVDEEILVGLFGGTRSLVVDDRQAANVRKLIEASHREGEGLHIDEIVNFGTQDGGRVKCLRTLK